MKIGIIGPGAMGKLFGAYLSKLNQVYLIHKNHTKVEEINKLGITIKEKDQTVNTYFPKAFSYEDLDDNKLNKNFDLIILFVKSINSKEALNSCKNIISNDTFVMTLQNGSGHDEILKEFVSKDKIIIGTTQHNSCLIDNVKLNHTGTGKTVIGSLNGNVSDIEKFADEFSKCCLETSVSLDVKRLIWRKLFTNVSISVMSAILRVNFGFLADNDHCLNLVDTLIKEAVNVANGDGMEFDENEIITEVHNILNNSKEGFPSIYADLISNRKTEVDTISGSVLLASKRNGVKAPCHEFVVELVHALEDKNKLEENRNE